MSSSAGASVASPASNPRAHRLGLLAALYVSQAVPLGFFIEGVPAIARTLGLSLQQVGLIQALALPFMIKFLWAPIVDGRGSANGHYRSWLVPLQGLAVVLVVGIAFLDPVGQLPLLLLAGGFFMFVAATQDIASDALAVRILTGEERGVGNGIQVGGYYLGQILGGGLILILFGRYGWTPALLGIAVLIGLPLLFLKSFREPRVERVEKPRIDFATLGRFFRRPGSRYWIPILLLYRAGETMAVAMARPMFVDLGLELEQIGLIVGLGASVAALSGALTGGALVNRLGRKRSIVLFAVILAVALLSLTLPTFGWTSLPVLWLTSIAVSFSGGMATTALYTHMMDRVGDASGGTDFTLQQSLAVIGPLVGVGLSGAIAGSLGYAPLFVVCAVVTLTAAGLAAFGLGRVDESSG